jgi:O-antigen/teichoic acid export membrane protein
MFKRAYRFIAGDYLLRNSAIIATGAALTGALNYLFQVFMARKLTVAEYGVFGAFFALFYMVTFSGQAVSMFTTKNAALARTDLQRAHVLRQSLLMFGGISLAAFLLYTAATPLIMRFLHVDSVLIILLAGAVMVLTVITQIVLGFARGLEDFLHSNISNVGAALVKLLAGAALVLLGFRVGGSFVGIIIGSLLGAAYLFIIFRKYLRLDGHADADGRDVMAISRSELFWYLAILFLAIQFIDIDVLLVKYLFSEYDAGLYAALSLLGKIVLFVSSAAVPAMFPKVVKHIDDRQIPEAMRFFWKSLGLTAAAGGAIVLVYLVMPGTVVRMLYGSKYPIQGLVALAGAEVLLYSILNVIVMLALAMKRYRVLWGLAAGVLLQALLIIFGPKTLAAVLYESIIALAVSIIATSAMLFGHIRRQAM